MHESSSSGLGFAGTKLRTSASLGVAPGSGFNKKRLDRICEQRLPPPGGWYALRVKPRHEKAVAEALRTQGYDEFLPLYRERRRWSDRTKEIDTPLFANYTFCHFALQNRLNILCVPGVLGIVRFGNTPAEVDPREIDAVRAAVGSGRIVRPCEFLTAGQRVRIISGPLANIEGFFQRFSRSGQLIVSVTILQRSVSVELEDETVIPIPAQRRSAAASSASSRSRRPHEI